MKWKWLMFWKRRHNVSVAVSKATHLLSHKNTTLQSAPSCTLAWTHLPHGSAKCFSNAWLFIWLNRQVIRQLPVIDSVSYSSCHTTMLLYAALIRQPTWTSIHTKFACVKKNQNICPSEEHTGTFSYPNNSNVQNRDLWPSALVQSWTRGYLKIITLESIGLLLNADNIYASKTVDMFNLARVCWLGNLKLTCICSQSIAK